ncbi:MAG: FecR domain-containing protein [Tannerella sp.]|nr:FecR domain-containing protein [Tannerella sp.]
MNIIIIRQLDGSISPDEKRMLLQWLKASEAHRMDYREIRDLWLSCDAALRDDSETAGALTRIRQQMRNDPALYDGREKRPSRPAIRRFHVAAAVVILVLLCTNYWFAVHPFAVEEKEPAVRNRLITAENGKGKFVLPDGSVVWLNAESVLTCPETFDGPERRVHLEGEGYFEVVGNRMQPFVVQTGNLTVEALGTAFDISGYSRQHKTEVVLLEGSVKVTSPAFGEDIVLFPDQMLELADGGEPRIRRTKARMHAGWIRDRLVFDNDLLSDIIPCLEGWYRMEIACPPDFAETTRLSFTVGMEDIQEILKAMSLVVPVTWSASNGAVTIYPK